MGKTGFKGGDKLLGSLARIYHRTEHPDHTEDPRDSPLIKGVEVEPAADEIGGNICLKIGEGQDQVWPQLKAC